MSDSYSYYFNIVESGTQKLLGCEYEYILNDDDLPPKKRVPDIGDIILVKGEKYYVLRKEGHREEVMTDIDDHGAEYDYFYYNYVIVGRVLLASSYLIVALDNSSCIIIEYSGTETEVKIPWKIDGRIVVGVNPDVFQNNPVVTEIQLPKFVSKIGNCFFKGCASLNSITIPNSIIEIASDAFMDCPKLSKIIIGKDAYEKCMSELPEGVEIQIIK